MSLAEVITSLKDAVSDDPAAAQATFRVAHDLVGTTEVAVRAGAHRFTIDEPEVLGGSGKAPNPVEFALAALGSCQAISYRFWAEQLGVVIDNVKVDVEGDLDTRGFLGVDDVVRPGFGGVRVSVRITGPDTTERYRQLADAVNSHCPVGDIFANPVPVSYELELS